MLYGNLFKRVQKRIYFVKVAPIVGQGMLLIFIRFAVPGDNLAGAIIVREVSAVQD